jgi:hypothetical protein
MNVFLEISGLNIYIQIAVTIISIAIHLLRTRNSERKETTLTLPVDLADTTNRGYITGLRAL